MIVTIHQPEHMPWLGFFNKVSQADVLVLLDNVQFTKNYFQNRNRILGCNGPAWLTVPVISKGHTRSTIAGIQVADQAHSRRKWWASLSQAYGKAPYYAEYEAFFRQLAAQTWIGLSDLNEKIIRYLLEQFQIEVRIVRASQLEVSGGRSQLLLDICKRLGATTYLSGMSGRDYLDESLFEAVGIGVSYHHFEHPVYPQFCREDFVSHMSAVDLLFNCGNSSAAIIRNAGH